MKTYKELIVEAKHSLGGSHGAWGIITKHGQLVDGTTHPTARQHAELVFALNDSGQDTVEYYHHPPSGAVVIRTWSAKSLGHAIEHFNKLPHGKTGMVNHEHSSYDANTLSGTTEDFSGKRYQVLPKMKALHAKLTGTKESLSEMAQDPHKAGYKFHVIPDDSNCGVHTIVATHPSAHKTFAWRCLGTRLRNELPENVRDQVVGHTQIQHDNRPILGNSKGFMDKPHDLYVDADHRRKGVASGMYDAYHKHTGRPVKPSPFQTKDAEALWKDRRKSK